MLKTTSLILVLISIHQIHATIDTSDFGVPQTNHKSSFGSQIEEQDVSALSDDEQVGLDLVDEEPAQDSASADVASVRDLFANAKYSIKTQRQLASQNSTA